MEQPRNIEIFNRVVILTLAKLYESFPTQIDLDVEKIGYEAIHDARDDQANERGQARIFKTPTILSTSTNWP